MFFFISSYDIPSQTPAFISSRARHCIYTKLLIALTTTVPVIVDKLYKFLFHMHDTHVWAHGQEPIHAKYKYTRLIFRPTYTNIHMPKPPKTHAWKRALKTTTTLHSQKLSNLKTRNMSGRSTHHDGCWFVLPEPYVGSKGVTK